MSSVENVLKISAQKYAFLSIVRFFMLSIPKTTVTIGSIPSESSTGLK